MSVNAYGPEAAGLKVLIRGTLFPYAEKAPFTPSGLSVYGGIEVSEDEATVKCHECGAWLHDIHGSHLKKHGISSRAYRTRHGIRISSALTSPGRSRKLSESSRRRMSEPKAREQFLNVRDSNLRRAVKARGIQRAAEGNGTPAESKNLRMNCRAQLTVRITNLAAKLGRTPTASELQKGDEFGGLHRRGILWAFGMTVAEALKSIGLTPNSTGHRRNRIAACTELAILQMRAQGKTFREIGAALSISPLTAWQHCEGKVPRRSRGWKLSPEQKAKWSAEGKRRMQNPALREAFIRAGHEALARKRQGTSADA